MHEDFHLHGDSTLDQAPADPFETKDQHLAADEVKGGASMRIVAAQLAGLAEERQNWFQLTLAIGVLVSLLK